MEITLSALIAAYTRWLSGLLEDGWEGYFVSYLFHPLGGPTLRTVKKMEVEVERFHATLLKRMFRHPGRPVHRDKLPLLIGIPDLPVAKRRGFHSASDMRPNGGLHYHGLLAVSPGSRLGKSFERHFLSHHTLYKGVENQVAQIDVTPIDKPRAGIVDYTFKHIKRRSFTGDEILILPKSRSELDRLPRASGDLWSLISALR